MRKYDEEFKRKAVAMVLAGQTAASVARDLGVSEWTLSRWRKSHGPELAGEMSPEIKLRELQRENAQLRMENEILKKAALILGRRG